MKKLFLLTLIMFSMIGVYAQFVIIHEGRKIDCAEADNTYDISLCVKASYVAKVDTYNILINKINKCIDSHIANDTIYLSKNYNEELDYLNDFIKLKKLFNQSHVQFIKMVEIEGDMKLELHDGGSGAGIEAMIRMEDLYTERIRYLLNVLQFEFCFDNE